jgi:hypothetical protein
MRKTMKPFILSVLLAVLLVPTMSCVSGSEANLVDTIISNMEGIDGEATFQTEDGRTIKISISGESNKDSETNVEENKENKTDESTCNKNTEKDSELAEILPTLNSIEDVFKTLGVWEQASEIYKQVCNWAKVAEELGYNNETMYNALQDDIENRLKHARELGLINQEQFEYKIQYFGERALKWVNKIFADTGKTSNTDLADILPSLNSIEDVFKTLGVWDSAHELCENGLDWSEIAVELGLSKEIMIQKLQADIEERLHHAKELGLISYEQYQNKSEYYNELALKWVNKIFME